MAGAVDVWEQTSLPTVDATTTDPIRDLVATLPIWWARRAAAAGLPPHWQDWRFAFPPPPMLLNGRALSGLVDASPEELGAAYLRRLDPDLRTRDGRHYTPVQLADALWQEVEAAGDVVGGPVVDPACGIGSLLLPPLRQFLTRCSKQSDALGGARRLVSGTDLDATAVWIGNVLLAAELLPYWKQLPEAERPPFPQFLHVADGLTPARDSPNVILMNPPFGRVRLTAAERRRWERSLYGHANRYALFLHAAIERVRPNGLVAAVLPASFLGGNYYQLLRRLVAETAPLKRIVFVDERSGVFAGDVLQETCLAIFQKRARPGGVVCSRLAINGSARLVRLPDGRAPAAPYTLPWLLPRQMEDGPLVARAASCRHRLVDYGWQVSTGPLVWNRHKPQISGRQAAGAVPILWAADILGGTVRRDRSRDSQRWITLRPRDHFMRLARPAVLLQRTTAPEQPRRLVPAILDQGMLDEWDGAVVVENHVNVLTCSAPCSVLSPTLLATLLATPTIDRLYRCLTGSVAVSAYELEALPLPPPDLLQHWHDVPTEQLADVVATFYSDVAS